jgi:rhodanese-related sulfurtransferase
MDSRESVRDRRRTSDQRGRRAEIRVLMIKDITPREFLERRAGGAEMTLLDVREDWETKLAPVPAEIVHIPMGQIAERLGELDLARETVVICRSGGRSLQVAHFLAAQGCVSVYNLVGGILAWSRDLDPRIPQY